MPSLRVGDDQETAACPTTPGPAPRHPAQPDPALRRPSGIPQGRLGQWSNGAQVEFERRYSKGIGFQVFYMLVNTTKAAGHGWYSDSSVRSGQFVPPRHRSDGPL